MAKLRFALAFLALSFAAGASNAYAAGGAGCAGIVETDSDFCQATGKLCSDGSCQYECYNYDTGSGPGAAHIHCFAAT